MKFVLLEFCRDEGGGEENEGCGCNAVGEAKVEASDCEEGGGEDADASADALFEGVFVGLEGEAEFFL